MSEELRNKARELLKNKKADIIIGYQRAADGVSAKPCFVDSEKDADLLIWDAYCIYNLANYLNPVRNNEIFRNENKISNGVKDYSGRKIGIVAKGCDIKSIVVLLQENQIKRENLFIIGVDCLGVVDEKRLGFNGQQAQEAGFARKCKKCPPSALAICDFVIKDSGSRSAEKIKASDDYDEYESIRKAEAKAACERLKFWEEEFSRCIRCYACSRICPMCYCPKCVADQTMPAWFSKGTNLEGNFSWNVVRAMHLAGRCIDCGECERACPAGIPLREINKKIEKDVKELFSYEAGTSAEAKPLFSCFDKNDPEGFIK